MTLSSISMHSIADITTIQLPNFFEKNGGLIIVEGITNIPFSIARVFTVIANQGAIRGQHAHKTCSQFLTCVNGSIEVLCDDGSNTKTYLLDDPKIGLLLPPGIWAQQNYLYDNSVLNVICDRPYSAEDYIRDYQQFKTYRK